MPDYSVYIQGGTGSDWHLSVQEDKSRVTVLDVRLSPSDAWKVQVGGGVHVDAFIGSDLFHLGKTMRNWQRKIPFEVSGYGELGPEVKQWAIDAETGPFETVDVYRTNSGAVATYRIWEDDDE